jgi:hypothetical protein
VLLKCLLCLFKHNFKEFRYRTCAHRRRAKPVLNFLAEMQRNRIPTGLAAENPGAGRVLPGARRRDRQRSPVYEVTNPTGEVGSYDVSIKIKEAPKSPTVAKDQKI